MSRWKPKLKNRGCGATEAAIREFALDVEYPDGQAGLSSHEIPILWFPPRESQLLLLQVSYLQPVARCLEGSTSIVRHTGDVPFSDSSRGHPTCEWACRYIRCIRAYNIEVARHVTVSRACR